MMMADGDSSLARSRPSNRRHGENFVRGSVFLSFPPQAEEERDTGTSSSFSSDCCLLDG